MTNATIVNRSFTEQEKRGCKHLFWERRWHSGVLNTKAQTRVMLKGEISTHQFCPEQHSAAELITDSQSVSSVQTVSVTLGCRGPRKASLKSLAIQSTSVAAK